MCNTSIPRNDSTTGEIVSYLKWHHGFLSESNVWKTYEDLDFSDITSTGSINKTKVAFIMRNTVLEFAK